jgi:hypothetical protein
MKILSNEHYQTRIDFNFKKKSKTFKNQKNTLSLHHGKRNKQKHLTKQTKLC